MNQKLPSSSSLSSSRNRPPSDVNTTTATSYKLALVGSDQISILELSASDGKLTPYNSLHNKAINDIKWNHNNKVLISCSDDGSIVMGTPEGENFGKLTLDEQVLSISVGESSLKLCSGGTSCLVKVWDLKKKEIINSFKGHKDIIMCVTFSESDQHVASSDASGTILIHNIVTNTLSCTLSNTQQAIKSLEYSPFYKTLLASAGDDGTVTVWDTISGKPHCTFPNQHQAPCIAVHFSKQNAALLASAGLDKNIYFYDIKEKRSVENIRVNQPISSFSYLDNGSIIAVGTSNGNVLVYDLKKSTTSPISELIVDRGYIKTMSFQSKSKKPSLKQPQPQQELKTKESISDTLSSLRKATPTTPPPIPQERPMKSTVMNINSGMDVFSPIKTGKSIDISSTHFPTVEDIKKQAKLEHFSSKINTKLSLENPFKVNTSNFKNGESKFDLNNSQILENSTTNRLSMYKSLKPTQDDRSVFSPSGPTKKPKFNSPSVDDTNNENLIPPTNHDQHPLTPPPLENDLSFEEQQKQYNDRMIDEEESLPSSIIATSTSPHILKKQQIQSTTGISEERLKDVVRDALQESAFTLQSTVHQDLTNMHVDILRQFCLQQEQTFSLIEQLSKQVQNLTEEVKELREENKQLKNLF